MPIYEYECEKCGSVFELIHAVTANPPEQCETPKCKGKPRRMVSAGGFILKGDGWYANDYPSESRKKGWESESQQGKPAASESKTGGASSPEAGPTTPAPAAQAEPKPTAKAGSKNPYTSAKPKSKPTKKTPKK